MRLRALKWIFSALLYLLPSAGILISVHFCHGNPVSYSLIADADDDTCHGKKCKTSCCEEKQAYYQIAAPQCLQFTSPGPAEVAAVLTSPVITIETDAPAVYATTPARAVFRDRCILYCSLITYG